MRQITYYILCAEFYTWTIQTRLSTYKVLDVYTSKSLAYNVAEARANLVDKNNPWFVNHPSVDDDYLTTWKVGDGVYVGWMKDPSTAIKFAIHEVDEIIDSYF